MDRVLDKIQTISFLRIPLSVRTIYALILREMATSYGRVAGGYLWAFAEPIGGIVLLTLVFSFSFHAPPLGRSFALFYATGVLPFMIYSDLNAKLSQAINFSRPLLGYPRVTLADALIARACLNALTQITVFASVFFGLILVLAPSVQLDLPALGQALGAAIALGLGLGTLNCFLISRFPVWQRVWSILNRPLFLMSCIVFTFETVPDLFRPILWFNPLVHLSGAMRQAVYFGYAGQYVSLGYVWAISGICAVVGLGLIWLTRDRLLNP